MMQCYRRFIWTCQYHWCCVNVIQESCQNDQHFQGSVMIYGIVVLVLQPAGIIKHGMSTQTRYITPEAAHVS